MQYIFSKENMRDIVPITLGKQLRLLRQYNRLRQHEVAEALKVDRSTYAYYELASLLNISETQLGYITNVAAGCGLIRCAGNIVPFENSFPRSTRLYQLMTTKPDEVMRKV